MQIVTVPSSTSYSNLNTLASISVSKSFVITNHTSGLVSIIVSPTQPADDAHGVPLYSTQTFYVEESDTIVWIKGTTGKVVIQDTAEIVSPYSTTNLPRDVWTSSSEGFRRLRVDPGQTGFFEGRFFRSYIEALIPKNGPSVQFRFTSPIDFILWSQVLEITQGGLELRVFTGATSTGTWTQRPVIGVNRMNQRRSPFYSAQATVETGGNFTGGTEIDLIKLRASSANNSASNVGLGYSERGLPAGTYHGRFQTLTGGLTVNDAAQMIYSLLWEERP